jgi:hypothetical protein
MSKPILCLDFDGVIHSYSSGWKGADVIPDAPTDGAAAFLDKAVELFDVQVFSSRTHQPGGVEAMKGFIWDALAHYFDCPFAGDPRGLDRAIQIRDVLKFPTEKPAAMVTIDDRALCFTGNWSDFDPKRLLEFKPWNKQSPSLGSTIAVSRSATLTRRIQTALRLIFAPQSLGRGA